jgi:hypothetical protein
VIAELDRLGALATVYRGQLLTAHKADGRWAKSGDRSFEAYRARTTGTGRGAAHAEMELAQGLDAVPAAARAVSDGELSLDHARQLARVHARSGEDVRHALREQSDDLLDLARRTDAPTFAKRIAAWAAGIDAQTAQVGFDAARARRYVHLTERDGGGTLNAFLDPLAFAAIRTAIEAHNTAPGPDDARTPDQRRADALSALAEAALAGGAAKIGAQIRPHLSLLVPAQTWAAVRRPGRGQASGGSDAGAPGPSATPPPTRVDGGAGVDEPVPGLTLPELDDGTLVPLTELERLACDCEITRIVLDADAVPLDVGRTQRTYSKALRRAVLVRDGQCRWPGCTQRAEWCDVHHIRWFSRGGATSLDNALTLCNFHHHETHRHAISIEATPAGTRFTRPDGTIVGTSRPAGARRLRPPAGSTTDPQDLDAAHQRRAAAGGRPAAPAEPWRRARRPTTEGESPTRSRGARTRVEAAASEGPIGRDARRPSRSTTRTASPVPSAGVGQVELTGDRSARPP